MKTRANKIMVSEEPPASSSSSSSSSSTSTKRTHPPASEGWKERIAVPTLVAGLIGGGLGLVSRHRKTLGAANVAASYAANLAIVAGCYCAAREVARDARASEHDDLVNSMIGGLASGALLGRFQGGQLGAIKYSIAFAAAGTAFDFATSQIMPYLQTFQNTLSGANSYQEGGEKSSWWTLPEWSPIQVLDEEALEAKRAREKQLYSQNPFTELNKKES